jgi:sortase A
MATGTISTSVPAEGSRRRWLRRVANGLIVAGVLVILYAGLILFWGDPVTWVWAHWEQRALRSEFTKDTHDFGGTAVPAGAGDARTLGIVAHDANVFAHHVQNGHAFGKLTIGRIGLSGVVVVQGTDRYGDLDKGPGHYANTTFPGLGSTVAIAGHRTTFGAWFRHIDSIRDGDYIVLQMPYATFRYQVQMHRVVPNTDWSIIKPRGYDRLVLSACHPLYSASHRWVVFARAVSVTLQGGRTVKLPAT